MINEEKKIGQCLDAIFNQTLKPLEVIVVDGHSKDDTVKSAKQFEINLFYEDFHTRAGACQVGIENAKGDLIAFTDADCIPNKDWLENLVKEWISPTTGQLKQDIVGVGGGIINIGNGHWEVAIKLAMNTFLGSAYSVQGRLFKTKKFVKAISGCNGIYLKRDLLKIGGFNTKLETAEDIDICNRLLPLGKFIYTPDAIILHNHNRGLKSFAKRMYQYGDGRAKSKLLDLQVIPPLYIFVLITSLFFTYKLFLLSIIFYILLLISTSAFISLSNKSVKFLPFVILIFFVEHTMYALGYWKGLLRF